MHRANVFRTVSGLLCSTLALASLSGLAQAEPVTPWSVARAARPDAPAPAAPTPPVGGSLFGVPLATTPAARTQDAARSLSQPAVPAEAASEPAPDTVSPALNPLADGRLGALKAVRERPLFARSRRPPNVAAAPVVESGPEPLAARPSAPDLHLVGIVEGIDTLAAVLKRPNGDRVTVHLGETVDAWTVGAIGPHSLTLREGDHEQAYTMFATRAAEAVTAVRAVPAAPEPAIHEPGGPEADAEQ